MKKIFVLDTNVLLADVNAIHAFEKNEIHILMTVIEELDKQKNRQDEVGANARIISRKLDELRDQGSLYKGVKLQSGGVLKVLTGEASLDLLPADLRMQKADNFIIAYMVRLKTMNIPAILVSKDINVRIKCDALGVVCQDYLKMRVTEEENFYTGVQTIETNWQKISEYYDQKILLDVAAVFPKQTFYPNQIVILKSNESLGSKRLSALCKYVDNTLIPLMNIDEASGLKPRNKEQQFALDLLFDEKIKLVTMTSVAGTGKTLLALAAGCEQVKGLGEKGRYSKLIVSRPVMPLGRDIGFLPGTLEEKMDPWIAPIRDNLNFLMGDKHINKNARKNAEDGFGAYLSILQERGIIEVEAITYIRGRSIQDAFIIIDEAQNLSIHELKTIITRVGEGTKIVLIGDIAQIDNVYVDKYTNGLTYAVEKFKSHNIAGHITLIKGERSMLATLGADIL